MATKDTSGTVPQMAPVTEAPVVINPGAQMQVERQGSAGVPFSHKYPEVRGGVCEWCGVIDSNLPSEVQYKLCEHYRGMSQLRCSYCDETKDPSDVIGHSTLHVWDHPDKPGKQVVVCTAYTCTQKHEERFQLTS